jgi:hypothetical protein
MIREKDLYEKNNLSRSKRNWTAALLSVAVSGVFTGYAGLVVSALNFFGYLTRQNGAGRLGALLVAFFFPLMMCGAHAMDKIAEIDRLQSLRAQATEKRKQYRPEQWKKDEHTQL